MYSGYTYEQLMEMSLADTSLSELLEQIDVLIDGRYDETLRDLTLEFRGSSNQRVIDMAESRNAGHVITIEEL